MEDKATLEILNDPILMKDIKEALEEEGGTSLENFKIELGIEE